jgi:hypothetical protein
MKIRILSLKTGLAIMAGGILFSVHSAIPQNTDGGTSGNTLPGTSGYRSNPRGDVVIKGFIPDRPLAATSAITTESAQTAQAAPVPQAQATPTPQPEMTAETSLPPLNDPYGNPAPGQAPAVVDPDHSTEKTNTAAAPEATEDTKSANSENADTSTAGKSDVSIEKSDHKVVDLDKKQREAEDIISANPSAFQSGKKTSESEKKVIISSARTKTSRSTSNKLVADRPSKIGDNKEPVNISKQELHSEPDNGYMNVEGDVVAVLHERSGNLRLSVRTDDGVVQAVIEPRIGMRVPIQGSRVRVYGREIDGGDSHQVIRVSEIERVGASISSRSYERSYAPDAQQPQPEYPPVGFAGGPVFVSPPPGFAPPPPPPGYIPGPPRRW